MPDQKKYINGDNLVTYDGIIKDWFQSQGAKTVTGNPVVITDAEPMNAESVVATITPTQDLHGYDKPWVGGAGKNKLFITSRDTYGTVKTFTESTGTLRVNGTPSATGHYEGMVWQSVLPEGNYIVSGISQSGDSYLQIMKDYTSFGYITEAGLTFSSDGSTITRMCFYASQGAQYDFTYTNLMIRLASETDSSFAPYENICPISGQTQSTVNRCGKNLFNSDALINSTFTVDFSTIISNYVNDGKYAMGYVNGNATPTMTGNTLYETAVIPVKSGLNYVITAYDGNNFSRAIFTDEHGNILSKSNAWTTSWSHTASENEKYLLVSTGVSVKTLLQVEIGSEATALAVSNYKRVTIQFGQTIYGGTVDFNTGVGTVTHGFETVTSVTRASDYIYWATPTTASAKTSSYNIISDKIKTSERWDDPGIRIDNTDHFLLRFNTPYSSAQDVMTFFGGSFDVCYELATPFTIQLTPQQLKLLENNNTITTNASSLEVKYQTNTTIGDTLSVLDKRITQLDSGKANGAGLTFSVDNDGILCITY